MNEIKSTNSVSSIKQSLSVLAAFLFVYIILFEFILPVNKILPKPSMLLESFGSLWNDYDLLFASGITTSVIYSALILGYLFVYSLGGKLIKIFYEAPGIFSGFRIFKYFTLFFFALIFSFWFPGSVSAEFLFALLVSVIFLGIELYYSSKIQHGQYISSAISLGLPKEKIYNDVIRKYAQPFLFNSLLKLHYLLWLVILIYEFLSQTEGFGTIYRLLLYYRDFGGIFALGIFITLLIWLGKEIIVFFKNKIITWES